MNTSYVTISVFKEQILKDFDLFFVELINDDENEKQIGLSYLKLTDALSFIRSLYYRYYQGCFLLFDVNTIDRLQIVEKISQAIGIDCQFVKVTYLTVENFDLIKKHELCQLFMNNMVDHLKYGLQYLSGELLLYNRDIFPKNKIEPITAYKLSVGEVDKKEERYVIHLEANSYYTLKTNLKMATSAKERMKCYQKPLYSFNQLSNKLERVFRDRDLDEEKYYIKKSPYQTKNKNIASVLTYSQLDDFYNSKLGLLYQYFKKFNEVCSKYVRLSFLPYDFNLVYKGDKFALNQVLENMEVGIVDYVDNELSFALKNRIRDCMEKYHVKFSNRATKKIILVDSPEYYQRTKISDPYKKSLDYQHIIVCGERKNDERIILKCLHELLVQEDIKNQCLTLYDWKLSNDLKYVIRYQINKEEYVFYAITIHPHKKMTFSKYQSDSLSYAFYDNLYDTHLKRYGYLAELEAIIEYEDKIYTLSQTGSHIIPDFDDLVRRINAYNSHEKISCDDLREYLLNASKALNSPLFEELTYLLDQESYTYEEIISKDKKSLINISTKEGREFLKYMEESAKIFLNPRYKSTVLKIYQHFHYLVKNQEVYYYVGNRNTVNQKIEVNTLIRRIACIKGKLDVEIIKEIFSMMQVDFIRLNQNSVYPFTHKYLNDYIKNS